MTDRGPYVFICTGEASGDLHASHLIRALRERAPAVRIEGLGGDRMAAAGCTLRRNLIGLAAMWHKTAGSAVRILPILLETERSFAGDPPDVVVILDYPGFNFPLARRAKSRGIPVLWYIPPQMWAWGRWRMRKLRDRVAGVACIFPFEEEMYRSAGVPVRYVGHPLMDVMAAELDAGPGRPVFGAGSPKIGLLPGSRKQEVETLLPVMLEVAAAAAGRFPQAEFVLGAAHDSLRGVIEPAVRSARVPVAVAEGRTYDVMRQADVVLVASGTATLECALFGTPMVILYSITPLMHMVAKPFIRSEHIGLANVVAGKRVVPEFAPVLPPTPVIAAEVLDLLARPERLTAIRGELRAVRSRLGGPGASQRAAEEVLALAERSRRSHRDGYRRGCTGMFW
jgi:lipid-A-disaccharide synthase